MPKLGFEYFLVTAALEDDAWVQRSQPVKTKKEAEEQIRVWRETHEAQGWDVGRNTDVTHAIRNEEMRSIALHEYETSTKDRIRRFGGYVLRHVRATGETIVEKAPKRAEQSVAEPRPRRGRKPIGV